MNELTHTLPQTDRQVKTQPQLQNIFDEAKQEYHKLEEVFDMMGWGNLPDRLKIEIKDDIAAMVDELKGNYSTCDPFVLKRRERVTYWIEMYQNRVCSLGTAIDALKIRL